MGAFAFPWDDIEELLSEVESTSGGDRQNDRQSAIEAVGHLLADLVDWRQVFPGPVGEALEAVDDKAPALVAKIVKLVTKLKPFRKKTRATIDLNLAPLGN